jgi:hypothetical protein
MLYVALGRNVGDVPMSTQSWEQFRLDVVNEIFYGDTFTEPDTIAFGESRYGAMKEDTCVLVWFDRGQALSVKTREALTKVALHYGQECIAYSVSDTQYVMGVEA